MNIPKDGKISALEHYTEQARLAMWDEVVAALREYADASKYSLEHGDKNEITAVEKFKSADRRLVLLSARVDAMTAPQKEAK